MTQRTFNYTGRQRIVREDINIGITGVPPAAAFGVSWRLDDYDFPGSALVVLEAQAGWTSQRFEFGTLDARVDPVSTTLDDFTSLSGLLFRLKVVGTGDRAGQILGEADGLKPSGTAEENAQQSFIVVRPSDLGEVAWKLEFDEHQAILHVNSRIGDHHSFLKRQDVAALVMPEVFRQVLREALERDADEESFGWQSHVLLLARSLVPPDSAVEQSDEAKEDWVDRTITKFATKFRLLQRSSFIVTEEPS